jgi:hypothetical protein
VHFLHANNEQGKMREIVVDKEAREADNGKENSIPRSLELY